MRNRLECTVTTCRHNSDNLCDLPSIKVEGPGACQCDQTCCESFEPRSNSASNSSVGGSPSLETSIDCKAHNCTYNDNCKCQAECVCVDCCCGDVTSKSGTECHTFRDRNS